MNIVSKSLLFGISLGLFMAAWWLLIPHRIGPAYVLPESGETTADEPVFNAYWVSNRETHEAHSANIQLLDNVPITVWYGGTEEGHKDVAIFIATFADEKWSKPIRVIDRASAERGLGRYIRKVGNPTLHAWPDGRLTLYFVTVSVGGWAASNINFIESADGGDTWGEPSPLITSPFLNISTLVRTLGQPLVDSSLSLPVYHEFLGKFAEILRLSPDHRVLNKVRISRGKYSLQPAVLPKSELDADAYLRYAGEKAHRLMTSASYDGGRHWTKPELMSLPNPNAAVAVLSLDSETDLMALNDTEDGRHRLSLAIRHNDEWEIVRTVESETPEEPGSHDFEFSYPSLVMAPDGLIHLVYTWNQKRIRHLTFNRPWLMSHTSH